MPRTKYQGREFTCTLQAPTRRELEVLIRGLKKYAKEYNIDSSIEVLEKDEDPDGGYRAIVTAHNFNPFKWVKEKVTGREEEEEDEGGERFYRLGRFGREVPVSAEEVEAERERYKSAGGVYGEVPSSEVRKRLVGSRH